MNTVRQINFTNEIRFERKRHDVFEAFLDSEKWFQISYGGDRLKRIVFERQVGGQIFEDWGEGTGKLYATVSAWDPPSSYSTVSHMLGGGIVMNTDYVFSEDGDATVLTQRFSAFGPMSDEMASSIESHGSLTVFEAQLKSWIEKGEVIPPPSF